MSPARPSFSIAIAAYQAAATIAEAVESALAQTLPPVDVVVCDDGSTDDLAAALGPLRERIVLLRQENRGEAAAKNAAARATTGAFVAFLDADDFYYPRRLEALAELASARPELDVLTTNADLEIDGVVTGRYYPDVAEFPVQDQALAIIRSDSAIFGAAAVRRSTFEGAGGLNESLRSGDDWELWIRLALGGSPVRPRRRAALPLPHPRAGHERRPAPRRAGRRGDVRGAARHRGARFPRAGRHRAGARSAPAECRAHRGRARFADRRAGPALALSRDRLRLRVRPGDARQGAPGGGFPGPSARLLERRERRTGHSRLRKPMPSTRP